LAHTVNIALPHELTLEQNIFLARDYVREQFTRKGYAVDWSIHAADPLGDSRNIHLHILVPLRKIEGESFGKKSRYNRTQLREQVRAWRKSWAGLANRHLKRYGFTATIDERSLRAQGVKRAPTRHRGPQPKTKRAFLNKIRPPQPRSPVVKTIKHTAANGSVTIRTVIKNSALTRIGQQPTLKLNPSRQGWPPEAVKDWAAWGSKNPPKFFAKWPELAPDGFTFGGGPRQ
jgi:hypothetical protein